MTEEQENIINEFNLYLEKIKQIGKKARGNYLSWARYLSKTYDLRYVPRRTLWIFLKKNGYLLRCEIYITRRKTLAISRQHSIVFCHSTKVAYAN